mmetsp:Transcript_47998/g.89450  ORF Transcript_47998/g.89450 Transcript_47998/m.89450 type:complete len:88 (+) Transcript_47998:876-1139(+)|eukprot:CAMPEP_0114311946 /NCGR_PEP_ID=MMETSP0059-20121206/20128_1 /TAXON_ID=36894 /ORGANISM="Pyramimonas parkeae, Strain CCMP726" /LENGTH=87 /DNA_ID=CAMNT_0001436219 /DNA_START=869 /DNA_END=1132 /DNA_ORIENTATION=+
MNLGMTLRSSFNCSNTVLGICFCQENFDKPINEFTDDDLNDKVNLSKSKIEDGAPTVVGKGDDWRKKNFEEAEKRTKGSKPKGEQEA